MRAIRITRTGGPDVLDEVQAPDPTAGPGEIVVRHQAIGLNYIDTYQRTGLYPVKLPAILGSEAAGVVEAVGEGVTRFRVGDRAAFAGGGGGYAEASTVKADAAVQLPAGIDFETAAAAMLKGMTAEFLARRLWPLTAGDAVLVHAAAGGVGTLLCQWLSHLGMVVIGCVGAPAKAETARMNGCAHTILYRNEDVAKRVRDITAGAGVKVAYDSVGKATVAASLDSLAHRGLYASFGNASGPVPPLAPLELSRRGSLYMTRPTLFNYIATPQALDDSAAALFAMIASGAVKVRIGQRFPLADVRRAHEALEARETSGATILTP